MTSAMAALVASMTTAAMVFNVMVSGLRFIRASLDDLFVARRRILRLLRLRHKRFVGAEGGTCPQEGREGRTDHAYRHLGRREGADADASAGLSRDGRPVNKSVTVFDKQ